MSHPDPYKMTVPELEACGCPRCQDAIRMSGVLDQLIESQTKTLEGLARVEAAMTRIGA